MAETPSITANHITKVDAIFRFGDENDYRKNATLLYMYAITKKSRRKQVEYFEAYHFTTQESGEIRIQGFLGDGCRAFLLCPSDLVMELLQAIDESFGGPELSEAIKKKLATGKPEITVSVSKLIRKQRIILGQSPLIVNRMWDEDYEFTNEPGKFYLIESITRSN